MMYIILFFAAALSFLTLTVARLHETQPTRAGLNATVAVEEFLSYKIAVLSYATANPGFLGTVSTTQITLPAGLTSQSIPNGATNKIVANGTGGYFVYCWAPGDDSELSLINNLTQGDVSVGYTIQGGQWENPELGNMGSTPNFVPAGDLYSIVEIGD